MLCEIFYQGLMRWSFVIEDDDNGVDVYGYALCAILRYLDEVYDFGADDDISEEMLVKKLKAGRYTVKHFTEHLEISVN